MGRGGWRGRRLFRVTTQHTPTLPACPPNAGAAEGAALAGAGREPRAQAAGDAAERLSLWARAPPAGHLSWAGTSLDPEQPAVFASSAVPPPALLPHPRPHLPRAALSDKMQDASLRQIYAKRVSALYLKFQWTWPRYFMCEIWPPSPSPRPALAAPFLRSQSCSCVWKPGTPVPGCVCAFGRRSGRILEPLGTGPSHEASHENLTAMIGGQGESEDGKGTVPTPILLVVRGEVTGSQSQDPKLSLGTIRHCPASSSVTKRTRLVH